MCVRLTHCLTHVQPGMVYGSTAHQMLLGKGFQPLWASFSTCKRMYYLTAERLHERRKD